MCRTSRVVAQRQSTQTPSAGTCESLHPPCLAFAMSETQGREQLAWQRASCSKSRDLGQRCRDLGQRCQHKQAGYKRRSYERLSLLLPLVGLYRDTTASACKITGLDLARLSASACCKCFKCFALSNEIVFIGKGNKYVWICVSYNSYGVS